MPRGGRVAIGLVCLSSIVAPGCASGGESGSEGGDAGIDVATDASFVDGARDASGEAAGETCVEGVSCSPATCRRGTLTCATGTCRDDGPLPAGTRCGVFEGAFVCSSTGECVPCVKGDPCVVDGSSCTAGTLDCSAGKPTCVASGPAAKNTSCGTNKICDAAGKCVDDVITATVNCSSGTKTGDDLCGSKGFTSATTVNGYYWFQCAGPGDCPGGFKGDGTTCPDFCGGKDCVDYAFCGGAYSIKTRSGDGTTSFRADDSGYNCTSYNPGWMVRLRCRY